MASQGGRPPHVPTKQTRDMVKILSGYAVPQLEIAHALEITEPTLRRHYRTEIATGAAVVKAQLLGNLMAIANGRDGTALKAIIFTLQTRFGFSMYAPPPEPIGKKKQLEADAQNFHKETSWANLLQ